MIYVSITGLELRAPWNAPVFFWHALRSMAQAKAAPGNCSADARQIDGVHHTLSVWQSERAMRAYLTTGSHLAAMKAFRGIATGRTIGFEAERPPPWDEVHEIWLARGKSV